MTDGIIQQVIREHERKIFEQCEDTTYRWIIYYHQKLQQELIEKIKQELDNNCILCKLDINVQNHTDATRPILKKLIGDNKE